VLWIAGLIFAVIALVAGGLQLAAFFVSDYGLRHLILALFVLSVGISVVIALWRARR